MKCFLITAILLSISGLAPAQEDAKVNQVAAYYRCTGYMDKAPHKAFEYCSEYAKTYPNDYKARLDNVTKFLTAYNKISQYLKSVPLAHFVEITPNWAVYSPGLLATIPIEESRDPNYPILIKREFGSPAEEKLLAKAESLYKNPEGFDLELFKGWRHLADDSIVFPDGEPQWWAGTSTGILATELVTTQAVLYYYNVLQTLKDKQGKLKGTSMTYSSANLDYKSSIKKMDVYERAGKTFRNVYVANMTLTWGQVCGGLCGFGFTRNKIVVMSANGDILEMFLDDPVNNSSWIA